MATATERKFTSLRKRLDQLGYRQPLGVESLPLVEKLFGDLLHTTESLKGAKQQLGTQQEQKSVWDKQVGPYEPAWACWLEYSTCPEFTCLSGLVINISLCIGYTIYLYIAYIRPQPLGCLSSSVVRAPV